MTGFPKGEKSTELKTQEDKSEKFFLIISESQSTGKVEVKDTERVIITETRTPNQTLHDTVALQDFNRKIQAIKDLDRNECFVSTLDIKFEETKATAQDNQTAFDLDNYDTRITVRSKETIPIQLAELALGSQVVEFCRNLPIYWLTDDTGSDNVRVRRGKIKIKKRKIKVKF